MYKKCINIFVFLFQTESNADTAIFITIAAIIQLNTNGNTSRFPLTNYVFNKTKRKFNLSFSCCVCCVWINASQPNNG